MYCIPAIAAESNTVTNISISLQNIFSMEFYTDSNVLFTDNVPFMNVDPNKSVVYPEGRQENDGKSDVGILCMSNLGRAWFLKVQLKPNSMDLPVDKVRYYVDQPYNRNTGGRADGSLARSVQWYAFSETPNTVYSSGASDQSNLPFGTLVTFNYSITPSGLTTGKAYSAVVTYTMTTTP